MQIESMRQLGLSGGDSPYPERPGKQDCWYYVSTGSCRYGQKCCYNHPRDRGALIGAGSGRTGPVEYLERVDQHVCEYYMKLGTCKYGSACKNYHPRQGGGSTHQFSLNVFEYPLRPGEKDCSYYMKTGYCKYGSGCKFHHPQRTGASAPLTAPLFYPSVQLQSGPSFHQYPNIATCQVSRPSVLPDPHLLGSYAPMLLSSGAVPFQVAMIPVVSHDGQQVGQEYGLPCQTTPSVHVYLGPLTAVSTSPGPSNSRHIGYNFPDRTGRAECQY